MSDIEENGDQKGIENLTYRAGLHSHTTFSDGKLTPEDTLNQAAEYADKVKSKHPFEPYPMIIAITDHFNTQGTVEAIDLIQKNPKKYKNIKFVIGMETSVNVHMPSQKEGKDLHMLVWCVNPYEWPFKDMNYQEATENWGEEYKNLVFLSDYKDFVKRIQSLKYGLVAIAHPLRYFDKDETIDKVISELFNEFKSLKKGKAIYTEGYYQPYRFETDNELYERTSKEASNNGIYRTGSQDTHGLSIFKNR
jgi:predicted metal-dependent phosphoesterase TrpH